MTAEQINKMFILFDAVREGTATDEQLSELDQMLAMDTTMCRYYIEYINMCVLLRSGKAFDQEHVALPEIRNMHFWMSMAQYEQTASKVEIPKQNSKQLLIDSVVYPVREKRKLSKFTKALLLMNIAAMLFFFLFLQFAPPKGSTEVATLTDCINVKWENKNIAMEKGTRLYNDRIRLALSEGIAELKFDNNAYVTIEGPAEFQIVADDRINLNYGKIYSRVPKEATGFSVYTQNSKIIDLGTEFGVEVDLRGETRLHVLDGKIKLIAGQQSGKTSIEVRQGEARRISVDTSTISAISHRSDLFVREIDSETDFIWRGQTACSLADIVGGGDGFGKGRINFGIDHNGQTTLLNNILAFTQPVPFSSVSSNPFVDGVFVPYGPTQIDSLNNGVYDFGATTGKFYLGVLNGAWHKQRDNAVPRHLLRLGGLEYGNTERPAIYIHANQGVTFDLQAIRAYTKMEITSFTSICGVSETYAGYAEAIRKVRQYQDIQFPKASFYVLVDNRERFVRKEMTHLDEPAAIEVDIAPEDRFLTLVTTEGSDKNDGDWTLFGEPFLRLRSE